jgi:hypothetical protein
MKTEIKLLIALIAFVAASVILGKYLFPPVELTPEQKTERKAKDRLMANFHPDGTHINLVKMVKSAMHNPRSFEHVETKYLEQDGKIYLWMTYRGTNAFGAIVTNEIAATSDYNGNVKITK